MKIKQLAAYLLMIALLLFCSGAAFGEAPSTDSASQTATETESSPISIKVLILPKFELGDLTGDSVGEAQCYFEEYMDGADSFEVPGDADGSRLYVNKDGVALYLTGMGKLKAALNTMAILSDKRFDFSDCYILATGCAGSSVGTSVMGDVFLITAAVNYDLGHHADIREMEDKAGATWFHDPDFDDSAVIFLNSDLMEKAYAMIKDIPLETTERTRSYMRQAFDGAEWALRDPAVLRGTTATGDNYWKGAYDHANALLMIETYGCPDPYAVSEMEDIAVCAAARRMGMLDRLIILRDSVNMDVFMAGSTPESLWGSDYEATSVTSNDSAEAADIFETAMKNNFEVGRVLIDAILRGEL